MARSGLLPITAAAGLAGAAVVAGIVLLVWGLVRTSGDGDGNGQLALDGPLSPPAAIAGFTPNPTLTVPRPAGTPLPQPTPPDYGMFVLNLTTGDVEQLPQGVHVSPDGRLLALPGLDEQGLDILDLATRERVRVFDAAYPIVAWSPDSRRLALVIATIIHPPDSDIGIYIANVDGSGYRKIAQTDGARVYWSPAGDLLAVLRQETVRDDTDGLMIGTIEELFLLDVVTGEQTTIVPPTLLDTGMRNLHELTWSPTGSQLAFVRQRIQQPGEIVVVDVETGALRTLLHDERPVCCIQWSPDGAEIAFIAIDGDRSLDYYDIDWNVYVARSDGGAPLLELPQGKFLNWSPDGRYLAFIADWCRPPEGPNFELAVYDRESTEFTRVTPPDLDALFGLGWSASSDRLAFYGNQAIYTVRPDGSELQRIVDWERGFGEGITWLPGDERLLIFSDTGHGICD